MEGHQLIAAMREGHLTPSESTLANQSSCPPGPKGNYGRFDPSRGGRFSSNRGNFNRGGRGRGAPMPNRDLPPGPPPVEWLPNANGQQMSTTPHGLNQGSVQQQYDNSDYAEPRFVDSNSPVNGYGGFKPGGRGRGGRNPRGGPQGNYHEPHFNSNDAPARPYFHHGGPRAHYYHGGPSGPPFPGPPVPPFSGPPVLPFGGPPGPNFGVPQGPPFRQGGPHGPHHFQGGPPRPHHRPPGHHQHYHGHPDRHQHDHVPPDRHQHDHIPPEPNHNRPHGDQHPQGPPPSYETAMMQTPVTSGGQGRYGGSDEPQRPPYGRNGRGGAYQQQQQWGYNQKRYSGRGSSGSGGAAAGRRDGNRNGGRLPEENEGDDRGKGGSARRGPDDYPKRSETEKDALARNWRDPPSSVAKKDQSQPLASKKSIVAEDDRTQRERLTDELNRGKCECMVCCDSIWQSHEVWSCQNCYNIFHLKCIKKWAHSPSESVNETGWRCPGCQNVTLQVPQRYFCFCGKRTNPTYNHYDTAHSCGEQCGRRRPQLNCLHSCNLLCHPGPCPPCGVYVTRDCACGRLSEKVRCGQTKSFTCGQPCGKKLNCGVHSCLSDCHENACEPCEEVVSRSCYCGKRVEEVPCTTESLANKEFSCDEPCGQPLECGNHFCARACHLGKCDACTLAPEMVTRCPCSKTPLEELTGAADGPGPRLTCADPVPVCGQICDRELDCGDESGPRHRCLVSCHVGDCSPCQLSSLLRCQCGNATVEVRCSTAGDADEMVAAASSDAASPFSPVVKCNKRCNKKKSCGRHKCAERCCTDAAHQCVQTCGRKLSCGLHTCDDRCHLGNCHTCWNTSFDELSCHCGATVTFPPIPCGTRPPECPKICSRPHGCDHPIQHKCHSDPQCPPCTFLTSKWCFGNHELRTCIPCFRTDVSCGLPCNRPLPCGRHACILTCHSGPCVASEIAVCSQPCTRPRPKCDHPCAVPCHDGECPTTYCKATVAVTCKCGHRSGSKSCVENQQIYQRMVSAAMAVKQHSLEGGQSVDITDAIKDLGLKKNCTLDCNTECALIDRNRRLALALQIRNPELTNKLKPPAYSEFLKDQVRLSPAFVTGIHDRLTELVQSAKQSKQKSRSHAFPAMKSVNRRIIHELAEYFGCETQAYDEEPMKNVVAIAFRDKSFLPSTSVISVVQKEMGILRTAGKAPPPPSASTRRLGNLTPLTGNPVTGASTSTTSGTTPAAVNPWHTANSATAAAATKSAPPIDYFDYNE